MIIHKLEAIFLMCIDHIIVKLFKFEAVYVKHNGSFSIILMLEAMYSFFFCCLVFYVIHNFSGYYLGYNALKGTD